MEETEHLIEVQTETDLFRLKGRPCELSAFSFVPTERTPKTPAERTVFNSTPGHLSQPNAASQEVSATADYCHTPGGNTHRTYDRLFTEQELGYEQKLHRDDREHSKSRGLNVHVEEVQKDVPTLQSTEYGHRLDQFVDNPSRKHVRIGHVKAEFYRRNGIAS